MSNASPKLMDLDFDDWQSNRVSLSPAESTWAVQVCQSISDEALQWQTLLRAMALRGFCQWLTSGAIAPLPQWDPTQPPPIGVNCQVNGFRLCLLAMGSLNDDVIPVPRQAFEGTHPAHLYILLQVQEEVDQVAIWGGLRPDQLRAYQQQVGASADDAYFVPVRLFNTTPEQILLYLNYLNPALLEGGGAEADLDPGPRPSVNLPGLINAGRWLQDQLDAVAESLSWILLPPLATDAALMALRSPTAELEAILAELKPTGVSVPPLARGAYRDLPSQGFPFRLYALIWPVLDLAPPEWSLFLFLGPQPGEQLPPGLRLTLSDAQGVLAEQALTPDSTTTYLYAQVFGTWEEQFTAAIALPDGTTLTLPTFVFNPS